MKGTRVFALRMITLAVSQAVYAEVGMLPEVNVASTTIDNRFDFKCAGVMKIAFVNKAAR